MIGNSVEQRGIPRDHIIFKILGDLHTNLNFACIGTSIVILVVMLLAGIVFSHRIAGPLLRFTRLLNALGDGQALEELTFRDGDYFQEVPSVFNRLVIRLRLAEADKPPSLKKPSG